MTDRYLFRGKRVDNGEWVIGDLSQWNDRDVFIIKQNLQWVEKRDNEYANYLGEMGLDMGIEMSLSRSEIDRAVEDCKHMIGLDYKRPYHRHQKAFYKPYRNYYCATAQGEPNLDRLPDDVIKKIKDDKYTWYELTRLGLDWLGRQLKITIKGTGKE